MKRRKLTIGLGIAVAVLVLLLVFLQFFLGHTIKLAVNKAGSAILKTDVRIENVHARILSGKLKIDGILIGAPEGFDANVFEMNNLTVDIDVPSLFSDTIHIREVTILDPIVTYELKGLNSNLSALLAPFEKKDGEEEKEVKEEKPAEKEPAEEKEVKEEKPAEKEPAEWPSPPARAPCCRCPTSNSPTSAKNPVVPRAWKWRTKSSSPSHPARFPRLRASWAM